MKKLRKIGITIIIVLVAYFLLKQLQIIPSFSNWFKAKPVLIENTPIIIENIKDMQELITIASYDEVVITKIRNEEHPTLGKILNPSAVKKLVLIAKGKIYAGTNLKNLKNKDVTVIGDSISITLPKTSIIDAIVNPSDCEIFIENGNWSTIEVNNVKLEAKSKMQERALERNILEKASKKSALVIENFLRSIGFKKITIKTTT
jgi:ribosomal protein S4E